MTVRLGSVSVALVAALLVGVAAAGAPAAAQDTLPGVMVPELIAGSWEADPAETPEEARGTHRCDAQPEVIRIVESEDGPIFEYQRGNMADAVVLRSDIRFLTMAIWLRYDLEWRTTEEGELVEWFLFMPDEDHFFMVRMDQVEGGMFRRSTMRRRCPPGIT